MTITSDLLAAYVEGKVSDAERNAIRTYLADNPSELKTVAMMMDEDYELDVEDMADELPDHAVENDDSSEFNIALSVAAFAPLTRGICKPMVKNFHKQRKNFDTCINDLLDEII